MRAELAPWDKRVGEVNSRIGIATAERDALAKRAEDARRRLDGALKGLAAAQQSATAKAKQIQELEAAAARCRCAWGIPPRRLWPGVDACSIIPFRVEIKGRPLGYARSHLCI